MATNIFKADGSLLTTVADGTIDTTHSTLKFPGKGYQNYGEPVLEDVLWTMQNFASASAPNLPLVGQTWYDTNTSVLKVYTGTSWQAAGGVLVNTSQPTSGSNVGAFWYDSTNLQLWVWDGTKWNLVGPLGSGANTDPIPGTTVPSNSAIEAVRISDGSINHQAWRIVIGGTLFAIVSKDSTYTPAPAISGFATINPGINFNTNISGTGLSGDSTTFKNNKNNLPNADATYDLGSGAFGFNNIYANNGIFKSQAAIGTSIGSYALQVQGTSYFNGTTTIGAGTTGAVPFALTQGTLATTPVLGAIEFDGTSLYITLNVNGTPTRSVVAAGTSGGNVAAVANTLALRDSSADLYANVFHGVATSARYADLAERYATDVLVSPGDVVVLGGSKEITTTTVTNDPSVFGVISTNPAYQMNSEAGSDQTHPYVALVGRVPCKVVGAVRLGDRLVTSGIAGVAMITTDPQDLRAVFARSLVNDSRTEPRLVEVVLLGRV